jgi:hypothetical protein
MPDKSNNTEMLVVQFDPAHGEPPSFYINHFQLLSGPWDVTVRAGQIVAGAEPMTAKETVQILLSPQSAKSLAKLLLAQVGKYEAVFGEVADVVEKFGQLTDTPSGANGR